MTQTKRKDLAMEKRMVHTDLLRIMDLAEHAPELLEKSGRGCEIRNGLLHVRLQAKQDHEAILLPDDPIEALDQLSKCEEISLPPWIDSELMVQWTAFSIAWGTMIRCLREGTVPHQTAMAA